VSSFPHKGYPRLLEEGRVLVKLFPNVEHVFTADDLRLKISHLQDALAMLEKETKD